MAPCLLFLIFLTGGKSVQFSSALPHGTMLFASLVPDSLVLAAVDRARPQTTTMLATKFLSLRGSFTPFDGALRLLSAAAVLVAVCISSHCVGGALAGAAHSMRAVLGAKIASMSKRGAAFDSAHFLSTSTMSETEPSRQCVGSAFANLADSTGAVLEAQAAGRRCNRAAPFDCADVERTMLGAKSPSVWDRLCAAGRSAAHLFRRVLSAHAARLNARRAPVDGTLSL